MTLAPQAQTDNDEWLVSDPNAPSSNRDPRLIGYDKEFKEGSWNLVPGDNYCFIMPCRSAWKENIAAGESVGKQLCYFMHQISIKTRGAKNTRSYRVPAGDANNVLTPLYWKIFNAFGKGERWKAFNSQGFKAGLQARAAFNVVRLVNGQLSPVMTFNGTAEDSKPDPNKPRFISRVVNVFKEAKTKVGKGAPDWYAFDPAHAVMLNLKVEVSGTFYKVASVELCRNAQTVAIEVYDISGQLFNLDSSVIGLPTLDELVTYATQFDQLPVPTDIPALTDDPQVCAIVGLPYTPGAEGAPAAWVAAGAGAPTPPATQTPVATMLQAAQTAAAPTPPVSAPQPPVTAAPVPPQSAPAPTATAAAPVVSSLSKEKAAAASAQFLASLNAAKAAAPNGHAPGGL